jgi:replicative DNA helicase
VLLSEAPLLSTHTGSPAETRAGARLKNIQLGLIVVDYLQLMYAWQ